MSAMRKYTGPADYEAMRGLLTSFAADGALPYATIGDLDWWRFCSVDPEKVEAALWYDAAGALVGFIWPGGKQVDIFCRPDRRDVEAEMLAWSEAWRRDACPPEERPAVLRAWSFTQDSPRIVLLQERGYTRAEGEFCVRERAVEALPPLPLPAGYRIRTFAGEEEIVARVEVHRAAFAPSRMTVEKHRAVMGAPTYARALDLVVEAPDGSLAAFCIVWFDAANRLGLFEPVGCHPDHQRRGLTKALMVDGVRRLHERGATRALVLNLGGAVAPAALYESVGFRVRDSIVAWERNVE